MLSKMRGNNAHLTPTHPAHKLEQSWSVNALVLFWCYSLCTVGLLAYFGKTNIFEKQHTGKLSQTWT